MGKSIAASNGNDCIYTPYELCVNIVNHFNPVGTILEPCKGLDGFTRAMPNADWCEITKGRDFLTVIGHWDWIITNPPYSKYRDFFNKSMEVADNIVFLQLINGTFYKARLRDMKKHKFGIAEICCCNTPSNFPPFGFQLGCVYYKRNHSGDIKFTYLEDTIISASLAA